MPSVPESWKTSLADSRAAALIDALREGGRRLQASALARAWLPRLARLGLREVDPSSGALPKEPQSWNPNIDPFDEDIYSAKVSDSRQTFLLRLNGPRSERGYRIVEVFESLPKTDQAILSALTNLEANRVDIERLESALSSIGAPVQEFFLFEGILTRRHEKGEGSSRRLEEKATQEYRSLVADLQVSTLEYVVALLRHYRPEFDDLPREEKHGLIVGCCKRVNTLLEASRQLGRFLEYGSPNKDLRPPVEKAQEYIRAAELKDVEGLSDCKIGEMLGIDPAPSDSIRRQNSRVNHAVKQGRRLLFDAWGNDGWQERAKSKSSEREWFFALSEEEQGWVRFAEDEGWGAAEGLRLAAEEEAKK